MYDLYDHILIVCFIDGGDYTGVGQSVTFNAGDGPGQVQEFPVTIVDDNTDEELEDFILQGSAGAPGSFPLNEARVEITDDDGKYACSSCSLSYALYIVIVHPWTLNNKKLTHLTQDKLYLQHACMHVFILVAI